MQFFKRKERIKYVSAWRLEFFQKFETCPIILLTAIAGCYASSTESSSHSYRATVIKPQLSSHRYQATVIMTEALFQMIVYEKTKHHKPKNFYSILKTKTRQTSFTKTRLLYKKKTKIFGKLKISRQKRILRHPSDFLTSEEFLTAEDLVEAEDLVTKEILAWRGQTVLFGKWRQIPQEGRSLCSSFFLWVTTQF